ncbi:MAG: Mut7-C RNAse domain-containing protein [Bacteroidales bacterium]
MNHAQFRFYEELNDFLKPSRKRQLFSFSFRGNPTLKDAIESLGVPHVEVDMILVNGISAGFSQKLENNDNVSVYPVFESFDISGVTHLRERPLRKIKFILDVHLGRMAKYLRLLGFDTKYENDYDDNEIINISIAERRVILTRDKGLLKNSKVTHGYWIRSQHTYEQLKEVIGRLDLMAGVKPFVRCLECNSLLTGVKKEEISYLLPPRTKKYYEKFKLCPGCKRIYWEGSHYEKMKKHLEEILSS